MQHRHSFAAAWVAASVVAISALVPAQAALTDSWTGLVSAEWTNGGNWSLGSPPSVADQAVIPTPQPGRFDPQVGLVDVTCGALTVNSGATLTLIGHRLTAFGSLTNAGQITKTAAPGALLVLAGGGTVSSFGACTVDVSVTSAVGAANANLFLGTNLFVTGSFQVGNFGSLTVAGNLTVNNGNLIVPNSLTVVTVGGNVSLSNMPQTTFATFQVSGNWFSDASYSTNSGVVTFTGTSPQTITGAGLFPSITVAPGAVVVTAGALTIAGDLFVGGVLQNGGAVTAGSLAFGVTVITGSVLGPGPVVLSGTGAITIGPNATIAALEIAILPQATFALAADTHFTGNFTLTSGILNVNGRKLTVDGTATFHGGILTSGGNAASELDLNGPVVFSGTTTPAGATPPTIRASSSWSADGTFNPTNGTVTFDGVTQTLAGPAPRFFGLTIAAGSATNLVATPLVSGTLTVAGTLALAANLDLAGGLAVTGTVAGPARLRLVGSAFTGLAFSGSVANLEVAKDTNAVTVAAQGPLTLNNFRLSAGRFATNGSTVTVNGAGEFVGGILSHGGFGGTLDLNGSTSFSGTAAENPTLPFIRCSGSWNADATFAPTAGTIEFDGTSPQTISGGGPRFFDLTLDPGSAVTLGSAIAVLGALQVNGGLGLPWPATVSGSVGVAATGSITGSARLRMVGSSASLSGIVPRLECAKSAGQAVMLSGTTTTQDLLATSGTINTNGSTFTVDGPAVLNDSRLSHGGFGGAFDFNGNVTLANTVAEPGLVPLIRAAGHWTADGAFAPNNSPVIFDGTAPQTITGSSLGFFDLTIQSGANVTTQAPLGVLGRLSVAGTLTSNVTLTVTGQVDVATAGQLLGTGLLRVVGPSSTIAGVIPHLECARPATETTALLGTTTVSDFVLTSGRFAINGSTFTVNGPATFVGGKLSHGGFGGLVDLNGNATFVGTTPDGTAVPQIRISGNWTSGASFAPAAGLVTFDGTTPQTIGGTSVAFFDLTIQAGANVTALAPIAVLGRLNVSGTLTSNFTVTATGQVDVFASGQVLGSGILRIVGNSSALQGSIPHLEIARPTGQTTSLSGSLTVADFVLTSGTFSTNGSTLTVNGPATFNGGTLSHGGFGGLIDINGSAVFTSTIPDGQLVPLIRISGNWTSDAAFAPTNGTVIFDGTSSQTIGGSSVNFMHLTIQSGANVLASTPVLVAGNLQVDGAIALSGTMSVAGNVGVSGAGAVTGLGLLRMIGGNASVFGAIPHLEIAKASGAVVVLAGTLTDQDFRLTSGIFATNGATAIVNGPAVFAGGQISHAGFGGLFDLNGAASFTNTTVQAGLAPLIRASGSWSADAAFAPTNGMVIFDGTTPQSIGGTTVKFSDLTIQAGAVVTASVPLSVTGNFQVEGTLTPQADVAVAQGVVVGAVGILGGPGTLRLVGQNSALSGAVSRVEIAKASGQAVVLSGASSATELLQTSGGLTTNGATLTVNGPATFSGGTLSHGGFGGVLDLNGSATFFNTTFVGSLVPTIRVAGNFLADAAFAPSTGTLELDGTNPSTIASSVPSGVLTFAQLTIRNGIRRAAGAQTWRAQNVTIESSGTFSTQTSRVGVHLPTGSTAITANGVLDVPAGGELALGPATTLTVGSSGRLNLLGAPGNPARLRGEAGGGYAVTVGGMLAARDFVVEQPGSGGFTILQAATLAAAPDDFRRGVFDRPANVAGAVLLDVRRPVAAAFNDIGFQNSLGVAAAFNVRVTGGAPVGFTNWSGTFGGPTFEADPLGLVTWGSAATATVNGFTASAATYSALLTWTSTAESGIAAYVVERAIGPGAFVTVGVAPATGPGAYQTLDGDVLAGVTYAWRLSSVAASGVVTVLANTSATTGAPAPASANILTVGPGGFPSIQAAIVAATVPSSLIRVRPGTYPAFTVASVPVGGLRISGDGTGPVVVDTASAPVRIQNTPAGRSVELADLTIGSAGSPNGGLEITGCAGPVIVDRVLVNGGSGPAPFGVRVSASSQVAVQRSQLLGAPALGVLAGSTAFASDGTASSVTVAGASRLTTAELTSPAPTVDATSTLGALGGLMPALDGPRFPRINEAFALGFDAAPTTPWLLLISGGAAFVDTLAPAVEMVVLLDPATATLLDSRATDAIGHDAFPVRVPAQPAIVGFSVELQAFAVDPATLTVRASNVLGLTITP